MEICAIFCEVGMKRKKICWVILVSILAFSVLSIHSAKAVDELYLTGIVRHVYLKSGLAVVDVMSQSCPGERHFTFDNTVEMEGLEGKKISFSIDSSVCKIGGGYKIRAITQEVSVQ
jgi:hypothetical protein